MGRKDKMVGPEGVNGSHVGVRMRWHRQQKGISLTDMALRLEYTKSYLSSVETGSVKPSSELIARYEQMLGLKDGELSRLGGGADEVAKPIDVSQAFQDGGGETITDWGEAPMVQESHFYGRAWEVEELKQWIRGDRCKIVVILGLGGIGKTTLASYLAEHIEGDFDYVFWRSLQNAPLPQTILKDTIQFLSDHRETDIPLEVDQQIPLLTKYLHAHRCLLVLDNVEAVLSPGEQTGQYQSGYEGYGKLFQRLGEGDHNSCLLLTSREKPKDIPRLEGRTMPVRTMRLQGLNVADGKQFLLHENLKGSPEIWARFIQLYNGNPLALKLVAEPIREVFQGSIEKFLEQEKAVIGDIGDLLEQQFGRLSPLEKDIMYWLAAEREAASLDTIYEDSMQFVTKEELIEAIQSLRRRLMIETQDAATFELQPVIMEFVTSLLIKKSFEEIKYERIDVLAHHTLIKAQAKEYVRKSQLHFILEPLARRLLRDLSQEGCEKKLKSILEKLRADPSQVRTYAAGNILNLLVHGINKNAEGYNFSSLFLSQAYLQDVTLRNFNFAGAEFEHCVFIDTFGSILVVNLSPDGRFLAAGTANGEIRLWHMPEGVPFRTLEGHTDWVTSVAFNKECTVLASGSDDQTVRLWDVSTGQCFKTLSGHRSRIKSIGFSNDGQIVASGSEDHTIRLWNAATGELINTLEGHSYWVRSVAFSSDGKTLASGSEDHTVRLWDIASGECIGLFEGHTDCVRSVAFSLDGDVLASGSDDHTIRLWEVETGKCKKVITDYRHRVYSVTFSPDDQFLASAGEDTSVWLWNASSGERLRVLHGHSNRVYSVAFSLDSKSLVSSSDDQTIRIWEVRTGECLKVLQGYSGRVRSVAFQPSGDLLASGSEDKTIRLWSVKQRRNVKTLRGQGSRVRSVIFSPDGATLASGGEDPLLRLWHVSTGEFSKSLPGQGWVYSVAFSPDGTHVASGSEDPVVRIWDAHSGQLSSELFGHENWVYSVAFSPDGTLLASSSEDRTIRLWDVRTDQQIREFRGHTNRIYSVAFSPDGATMASGSHDQTIRIWEVSTGNCLHVLEGHYSWVYSVAFRADGKMLASGSENPTIRLWDAHTGQFLKSLRGHRSWVYAVAFSPDGTLLASASHDGTIRLWNVDTGETVDELRNRRPYEGMNITGVKAIGPGQIVTLKELGAVEQ